MSTNERRAVPLWTLVVVVLLVAAVLTGVLVWHVRSPNAPSAATAALEARLAELAARADRLQRENQELRQAPGAPVPIPLPGATRIERAPTAVVTVPEGASSAELREKLNAANSSIADLEAQVQKLEGTLAKAYEESKVLTAAESEQRERADSLGRVVEALQAENRTNRDRLTQLETANLKVNEEARQAREQFSRAAQPGQELEEINRRREMHLSSILRRYRDLTEDFRSLAARLDKAGEGSSGFPGQLSRIQSAVAGAEDDLRQISGLNAQAARAAQRKK
jgi:chromosome segregation ATPase